MTKERIEFLLQRQVYRQPTVLDTPHEENANNVLYAIHHFGKPQVIRRFNAANNYVNGALDYGIYDPINVKIEIQPKGNEDTKQEFKGEHSEADYEFWHDPNHPDYDSPIYLKQSDSRFINSQFNAADITGYSDIIEYMGELYIIRALENWSSSSFEEATGQDTGYQYGELMLWDDKHNKRKQTIDNDDFVHKGDL